MRTTPALAIALFTAACAGRPATTSDEGSIIDAGSIVDAGRASDAGPADADGGFVDAGPDVVDDPAAVLALDHIARIGGSGPDGVFGASYLEDGTLVVSAKVADTGDVTAGDAPNAIDVDSGVQGVVAGFDANGKPLWARAVEAQFFVDDGVFLGTTPWPGLAIDGDYVGRIAPNGDLLWATPSTGGFLFAGGVGGGAATVFGPCRSIGGVACAPLNTVGFSAAFGVARLDAGTGAVQWYIGGRDVFTAVVPGNNAGAEAKAGLGAIDDDGRAYLLHSFIGQLEWNGAVVASVDGADARARWLRSTSKEPFAGPSSTRRPTASAPPRSSLSRTRTTALSSRPAACTASSTRRS